MSNYSDLITSQGATHYWSLDEATAPYLDTIGGAHLDHTESTGTELGVVNNGAIFASTALARTSAQDTSVTFNSSFGFSYSFFAKFVHYGTNRGLIGKRQSGTTGRTFAAFVFNTTTTSGLSFDIGANQSRWLTSYYPPIGEWVHIAYTYEPVAARSRAYVNGQFLASNVHSTPPSSTATSAHMMMGALQSDVSGTASSYMNGTIDEVAMFIRKTLSPAEILAQYNAGLPALRVYDGTQWHTSERKVI